MKINLTDGFPILRKTVLLFFMRLFLLLFCTSVFSLSSLDLMSQNATISFESDTELTVDEIFDEIIAQTDYTFLYQIGIFDGLPKVKVKKGKIKVNKLLEVSLPKGYFRFGDGGKNKIVIEKITQEVDPVNETTAQQIIIKGKVTDENGLPMAGATILVKSTQRGVTTDLDGRFSITVNQGETLSITYIGFVTQEFVVSNQTEINVVLKEDTEQLDEVLLISTGYQKITEDRSTGSYAKANSDIVRNRSSSMDVLQRLEGLIPGLVINNTPNSEIDQNFDNTNNSIMVRGLNSINANRQPLYVIDGIPVSDVSRLNPQDVDDIFLLKDATATAIYGSKATNGVIVITTKRGKNNQKLKIDYDTFYNFQGKPELDYFSVLNSQEYIQFARNIFDPLVNTYSDVSLYNNSLSTAPAPHEQILYDLNNGLINATTADIRLSELASFDNTKQVEDLFYRNASLLNHSLSLSGGSEKYTFYGSTSYTNSVDDTPGNKDNTYKLNFNQGFKFNDRIQLNATTDLTSRATNGKRPVDVGPYVMPYIKFRDEAGNNLNANFIQSFSRDQFDDLETATGVDLNYNPLDEFNRGYTDSEDFQVRMNLGLTIELIDGLEFQGLYGYINGNKNTKSFNAEDSYAVRRERAFFVEPGPIYHLPETGGHYYTESIDQRDWVVRNQLSFNKSFQNNLHSVNILIGQEAQESLGTFKSSFVRGYNEQLQTYGLVDYNTLFSTGLTNAVITNTLSSSRLDNTGQKDLFRETESKNRITSYYSSAAYTFDRKYTLNGSWRIDESNLFGRDKSAQNRPVWSIGGKWIISRESFLENTTIIDDLALRATYGITGNAPSAGTASSFDILNSVKGAFYYQGNGLRVSSPSNPKLSWESTRTINLGVDFSMLKNRLGGTIDFYQKKTEDLIGDLSVNPFTGYSSIIGNFGDMENKGIEFLIQSVNIETENFIWSTSFNLAYNKNKVTKLLGSDDGTLSFGASSGAAQINRRFVVNKPAFTVHAYDFVGLDDMGDPLIKLANGTITKEPNITTAEDVKYMGSYLPNFTGGFTNTLRYKDFLLNANISFSLGNVIRADTPSDNAFYGGRLVNSRPGDFSTGNIDAAILEQWQKSGDENNTNIPSYVVSESESRSRRNIDYYRQGNFNVVSGDYMKLRDITLVYNIPHTVVNKIGVDQISFRLQLSNLMLWKANDRNIDPEFHDPFKATRFLPSNQKTLTLGMHVSF